MNSNLTIEGILFKSREIFFHFVDECNNRYRSGKDFEYYINIIQVHRNINNIEEILEDKNFIDLLKNTLKEWNMDQRGAKLQNLETIKKNISAHKNILKELYKYKLHEIISLTNEEGEIILKKLNFIFKRLNIMKSTRQVVGGSKTLHFLLPDLIPPMDNTYTMNFYKCNIPENIDDQFKVFEDIFIKSHKIARNLHLDTIDIDNIKWKTSVPKLIDNAIIGFSQEFDDFIDPLQDDNVNNYINLLSKYVNFTPYENHQLKKYLDDRREKFIISLRNKIAENLLIQKAKAAGIIVTDEEIDDYLNKKKR